MGCCWSKEIRSPLLSMSKGNENTHEIQMVTALGKKSEEHPSSLEELNSNLYDGIGSQISPLFRQHHQKAQYSSESNLRQTYMDSMKRALEECCVDSDKYFGASTSIAPNEPSNLPSVEKLAHRCVSLQFLLEFNEKVVKPYRPTMTVKEVVEEIIIPATKEQQCSFIDQLRPKMYVIPHAFISHAFGNPFKIIVESLKAYFKDAVFTEVYVWIDIFIINQHRPGDDLHGGLTLKATIEASGSVIVCLDKNTLPLFRLWCLYEIGSTPIEKLVLLTHGFDASELGQAYAKIDATTADCWAQSDKDMIRGHIRAMMVEQKIASSGATTEEALVTFTRVLKLLLILKPTSYSADMAALLDRAANYESYPLQLTVGQACAGGKLVAIIGASGEGKSTLAAALVKAISIDAYHFCKQADIRRQDRGLVIRSLSYQLAIRHPAFAEAILSMTPSQVETLSDEATAFKLLLESPLKASRGFQTTILIDALDESGGDGMMISLLIELDNILGKEKEKIINVIVTTRPEPALLSPLKSHWKGERYQEFTPLELRGESQRGDDDISPLLRTLNVLIQRMSPDLNIPACRDINTAYGLIFSHSVLVEHGAVLEVVLASYQPQSLSNLNAMGMLEMVRRLPGYGELFLERENTLHLLHRSIADWLLEPKQVLKPKQRTVDTKSDRHVRHIWEKALRPWLLQSSSSSSSPLSENNNSISQAAVDTMCGHERLAEHIWETTLRPWMLSSSSSSATSYKNSSISQEPASGSYSLKYALAHLREAGRIEDIQAIIFRLPWLQAILKEKCLGGLIKDILSLIIHPTLAAATKKLVALLRMSSSALLGSDAWKYLPAQLLGRIRETEEDVCFQQLREEAESVTFENLLKPLKSSLQTPGSLELTIEAPGRVAVLPDGRIISASSTLDIWNTMTGDCERSLSRSDYQGAVTAIASLPDGRIVLSELKFRLFRTRARLVSVFIWNISTGECENTLSGHNDEVTAIAVFPDSRIVSGSKDKTLRIWNASTGACERTLSGHSDEVTAIAVLPDGRVVSGSKDCTLRIWNAGTGACERTLSLSEKDKYEVSAIAVLPDGHIVFGCKNSCYLRSWNASVCDWCYTWLDKREDWEYMEEVTAIAILPDGRIVSSYNHNQVSSPMNITLLESWGVYIPARSGIIRKSIRISNATTHQCERILFGHEAEITAIAILPDGRIVTSSKDNTVRIWNTMIGDECEGKTRSVHEGEVSSISVLNDGRIITGSYDKTVRIWNPITGACERTLSDHDKEVMGVVGLADGRFISHSRVFIDCYLWSPVYREEGEKSWRIQSLSLEAYDVLKESAISGGIIFSLSNFIQGTAIGSVAPGYSVFRNCVQSESFGRVFVDEAVQWVVKVGDVIAVFEKNGSDHWFREVSS